MSVCATGRPLKWRSLRRLRIASRISIALLPEFRKLTAHDTPDAQRGGPTDAEEIRMKANLVFLGAPPRPVRPLRRQYESSSTRRGYHVTFPTRASLRAAENK